MSAPPPRISLTVDDVPGAPAWIEPLLARLNTFTGPVSDALNRGISLRENVAGQVLDITVTPPDDWAPLKLASGWTRVGDGRWPAPAVKKADDGSGMVDCCGLINSTSNSPNIICPWPTGYAPADTGRATLSVVNGSQTGSVVVRPDGIEFLNGSRSQSVSLSGLRFQAGNRQPVRWTRPVVVTLGEPGKAYPGTPGCILPLACYRTDGRPTTCVATSVDWSIVPPDGRGTANRVQINRIPGLLPGVSFIVTLLVLPE